MSVQSVSGATPSYKPAGRASGSDGSKPQTPAATSGASRGAGRGEQLAELDARARSRYGSREQGESSGQSAQTRERTTGDTAARSAPAGPAVDPRAQAATQAAQERLGEAAQNHDEFHALMKQVYGENYDYSAAEAIRQQTKDGDFSWMPDIVVKTEAELRDISGQQESGTPMGAYDAENDTIYMSAELLAQDPDKAVDVLVEEIGHSIDVRVSDVDSAGDEGELFSLLVSGADLSQEEIAALQAENDHGVIMVDGKEVEVEYGCNPFKAIKKAFKSVVNAVKDAFNAVVDLVKDHFQAMWSAIKDMWEGLMSVIGEILSLPIFQIFMFIAQFIPVLNLVVLVIRIVQAVYMLYQGIKHGSVAMILGGIASLATGAANLGSAVGASASVVNKLNDIATWANRAAQAHQAISERDITAGLSLLAGVTEGTDLAPIVNTAQRIDSIATAVEDGDVVGALGLVPDLVNNLPGEFNAEFITALSENAQTVANIAKAVEERDYSKVAALIGEAYGDDLGLSSDFIKRTEQIAQSVETVQGVKEAIDKGDYAGAALLLLDDAAGYAKNDKARERIENAAEHVEKLAVVAAAIDSGDYAGAIALTADLLGQPLDPATAKRLEDLQGYAEQLEPIADAIKRGDLVGALGLGIALLDDIPGNQGEDFFRAVGEHATTYEAVAAAVKSGDYSKAAALLGAAYGEDLGLSTEVIKTTEQVAASFEVLQKAADLVEAGDYNGAAQILLADAAGYTDNDKTRAHLEEAAATIQSIDDIAKQIESGDYAGAIAASGELLGTPLDPVTREVLENLQARAEQFEVVRKAVDEKRVGDAIVGLIDFVNVGRSESANKGFRDAAVTLAQVEELVEQDKFAEALDVVADLAASTEHKDLSTLLGFVADLLRGEINLQQQERAVA